MQIPKPGLDFWNFDPKIDFWANLGPKISSCPFCMKIGAHSISRMLVLNPDLDFWNFNPKIHFWEYLGRKSQSCPFFLKIGTHGTLVFWISKPKSIFGQIWTEKLKVVECGWKLAHRVSWRCWFLFQHYFSQFPTLNPFLDIFGSKNSKLLILTENWHTWYMEDAGSYSDNGFLNC